MTARLAVWLAALVGLAAGAALIPGDGSGGSPLQELWAAAEEEHEEEEEEEEGLRGDVMRRIALWRQLGRPEAGLIGVQYRANDSGLRRGPWVVRNAASVPWLFAGTGLEDGAEVFAAGAFSISSSLWLADVRKLMDNLWARFAPQP